MAPLFKQRPPTPPRKDYPQQFICRVCRAVIPRHCKNLQCSWYDCKPCLSRTYIVGGPHPSETGGRSWDAMSRALEK